MERVGEVSVSVIVPVYNGEKYLTRAVDSILGQTLREIEIILVDDGSQDGTADVIRSYKEKYPDIIVDIYNGSNRSLGTTRNIGVAHARGEYIGFVDADDWIDLDFYEKMYTRAKEKNADIVRCGIMRVNNEGKMWVHCLPPESWDTELNVESKKEIVVDHFWGMWPCIFRRRTWLESGFKVIEETTYDEDMSSVLFVLCATRMAVIREPIYKYWVNPTGTGAYSDTIYTKALYAAEKILQEARRLEIYDAYKEELYFFTITSTVLALWKYIQADSYECLPKILEDLEKLIPGYMGNRYLHERAAVRVQVILQVAKGGIVQVKGFINHEEQLIKEATLRLLDQYKNKRIAIWGAAQRGQAFLEKYDSQAEKVCKVIDRDETLHGREMPTGHHITSYAACADKIDVILVMNHDYYGEIVSGVTNSYDIEFVDYEKMIYQIEGNALLRVANEE